MSTPRINRVASATMPTPSATPSRFARASIAPLGSPSLASEFQSPYDSSAASSSSSSSTLASAASSVPPPSAVAKGENTNVIVRIRPDLDNHQVGSSRDKAVWIDERTGHVKIFSRGGTSGGAANSEVKTFGYDAAFGPEAQQEDVWQMLVRFIDAAMKGINGQKDRTNTRGNLFFSSFFFFLSPN